MPKSCCAVGCTNHNMMEKKFSFFTFPKDPVRWEMWVNAVKRVNPDGSKWQPSKETVLCSQHFLTGKPKSDATHPDYTPSIFKHLKSTQKEVQSKLRRFNSAVKSKISFTTPPPAKRRVLCAVESENIPEFVATPVNLYVPYDGLATPVTTSEREQLYTEMDNLRTERDNLKEEVEKLRTESSGVRLNASSVENNEDRCKFYTGLGWSVFINTFQFLVSFVKPTPLSRKICLRDQFFFMLVKLRLDLPFEYMALNVGVSTSQASEIFWNWIEVMNAKMDCLIKWPDREIIHKTLPGPFRSKFPRLTSIIDCFEIFIDRPKKLRARTKCYSNYKRHSTVKVLIACTPNGSISFLSKAWGGRVSDVEIVRQSGFINPNLHMPGDQILADRGFTLKDDFATMCSTELIIPAFTNGKKQLTAQDVEVSRKISSVRIHIERVIGLMKCRFKILEGTISVPVIKSLNDEADETDLARIDKLLRTCAICVNLGDSIVYNE